MLALQPVTTLNPLLSQMVSTREHGGSVHSGAADLKPSRLFLFLDTNVLIDMVDPHMKAHLSPGVFTFEELLKKVGPHRCAPVNAPEYSGSTRGGQVYVHSGARGAPGRFRVRFDWPCLHRDPPHSWYDALRACRVVPRAALQRSCAALGGRAV